MMFIYKIYDSFWDNKKKISKLILIALAVYSVYYLFGTPGAVIDDIVEWWIIYVAWLVFIRIFHKLIGQYWILKFQCWQTKEVQREVLDKNMKASGKRRGYKDTIQSGMVTNFVTYTKEQIKEELESLSIHLFYFDLKAVDAYLESNIEIFNVASKRKKKENFMNCIVANNLFLKKRYENSFSEIMNCFKNNNSKLRIADSKYIISNGVNYKHIVEMLYDYMYMRWRMIIDIWVITNQPCIQSFNDKTKEFKMAKIYSPDLKSTKNRKVRIKEGNKLVDYVAVENMIAEDWLIFWESESDIWWNNIDSDVRKNLEERGIRWYEVAQGHIMGEHVSTLRNGQVAGRTVKLQRDLEESFYSVVRAVKVWGGAKRIFFIKLFMFLTSPIYKLFPNFKSYLLNKIERLKFSGWLKLETVFSRTEQINYNAPGISLKKLLDKNDNLYMSQYQTTLVFKISDCWGRYNTHYLEYVADKITANSEGSLLELPEWDLDLKLRNEHILHLNYDTVDIFQLSDEERYINNPKYKKLEQKKG